MKDCQESANPASLKSLVSMMLTEVNIENTDAQESQSCLTVCQTIVVTAEERCTAK